MKTNPLQLKRDWSASEQLLLKTYWLIRDVPLSEAKRSNSAPFQKSPPKLAFPVKTEGLSGMMLTTQRQAIGYSVNIV